MINWDWVQSESKESLLRFLLDHESDIAYKINDFGDLDQLFFDVIRRWPEKA